MEEYSGVWVFIEVDDEKNIEGVSLELLGAGRELAIPGQIRFILSTTQS